MNRRAPGPVQSRLHPEPIPQRDRESEDRVGSGTLRLTHVITDLETGGAAQMLVNLLAASDRARFDPEVVSLTPAGPMAQRIRALGVPVRSLGLRRRLPNPGAVPRLAAWLRWRAVDVVHGWLGHANLVAGLAALLARRTSVVWSIHHTPLDPAEVRATTRWTLEACRRLAPRLPATIVSCSESGARAHVAAGYPAAKMVVIPNGCDSSSFRPDPTSRLTVRHELGLPPDAVLIGQVGRFHPQKDHATAVEAAALLRRRHPEAHFVFCGAGLTPENARLAGWIKAAGVSTQCHLLGRRDDMSRVAAALDIATSTSAYGEACPLALIEAMSCGVPCVATDVGDAGLIVGDTGVVVPPRDPAALAEAWSALIELGRAERVRRGEAARRRTLRYFSLADAVTRYECLYTQLAPGPRVEALEASVP